MTHHKNRPANEDPATYEAVWAVLEQMPVTADQVAQAEKSLAGQKIPLPEKLHDPNAVFDMPARAPAVVSFPASPEVDATLARAAREAGHLAPEVQEQMRRDRQAAEEAQDGRAESEE